MAQIDNIHRSGCTSVDVSQDSRHLVTAGDKVIKVWDYHMRLDLNFQVLSHQTFNLKLCEPYYYIKNQSKWQMCVHGLDWSKLKRSANSRFINGQHSSEDLKMLNYVHYEPFSCNNCISFIFRLLNKVPKGRKLNVMTVALNIVLTWIIC